MLALYRIGRGSGWHRARQRVARGEGGSRTSSRGGARGPERTSGPRRSRLRLHSVVAGAWIVLSLLLLAYATLEGESAVSDLDGLELVTTYAGSLFERP